MPRATWFVFVLEVYSYTKRSAPRAFRSQVQRALNVGRGPEAPIKMGAIVRGWAWARGPVVGPFLVDLRAMLGAMVGCEFIVLRFPFYAFITRSSNVDLRYLRNRPKMGVFSGQARGFRTFFRLQALSHAKHYIMH